MKQFIRNNLDVHSGIDSFNLMHPLSQVSSGILQIIF